MSRLLVLKVHAIFEFHNDYLRLVMYLLFHIANGNVENQSVLK